MNELTEWAQTPTFGDDLDALLYAVERRMTTAWAFQDKEMDAKYSALFDRLQGLRSAQRRVELEKAAAFFEDEDWNK